MLYVGGFGNLLMCLDVILVRFVTNAKMRQNINLNVLRMRYSLTHLRMRF